MPCLSRNKAVHNVKTGDLLDTTVVVMYLWGCLITSDLPDIRSPYLMSLSGLISTCSPGTVSRVAFVIAFASVYSERFVELKRLESARETTRHSTQHNIRCIHAYLHACRRELLTHRSSSFRVTICACADQAAQAGQGECCVACTARPSRMHMPLQQCSP